MPRRPPVPLTIAALVVALTGLVAVASHGTPVWSLLTPRRVDRLAVLAGVAVLCAVGLATAGAIATVAHHARHARRPDRPPLATTLRHAIPMTSVALAIVGLLAIARADLPPARPATDDPAHAMRDSERRARVLSIDWWTSRVRAGEGAPEDRRITDPRPEPEPAIPPALFFGSVGVLVLGIAIAWAWLARRGSRVTADEAESVVDEYREAMHGTFLGTIDAMLADPDPGTAIRGAYARLLEGLAASGAPRRSHEAPVEHLHRVLTVLDVRPGPLRELIDLFAVARFSEHRLHPTHRERALEALRTVASDLRATSAFSAAGADASGARP